jgi:hypothetical protein
MKFNSIAEICSANDEIHAQLVDLISNIDNERAHKRVDGEDWSVAEIVEHISMVDEGVSRICAKLLGKPETAKALSAAGVTVSDNFLKHYSSINDVKLVAPDRVRPTGEQTIARSLSSIGENLARLREMIPQFEASSGEATFPHPYFGEMTAVEWLILAGGHEKRHTDQIRRLLDKM